MPTMKQRIHATIIIALSATIAASTVLGFSYMLMLVTISGTIIGFLYGYHCLQAAGKSFLKTLLHGYTSALMTIVLSCTLIEMWPFFTISSWHTGRILATIYFGILLGSIPALVVMTVACISMHKYYCAKENGEIT